MPGKPWTARDLAYLRRHYRRQPAAAIAAALGRSQRSVYMAAIVYGFSEEQGEFTAEDVAVLRRMVAAGSCNSCIGRAVGHDKHEVLRWRRKLGLPQLTVRGAIDSCPWCKERTRQNTREQLRRCGAASLAEVRVLAFRKYARESGWPEDLRPRAVQILSLLYREGPKTREEIAAAIGMPWKGVRSSLMGNDPGGSYLATLMRRGLVVCLGRTVKRPGRGHSVCQYMVPLGVEPRPAIRNGGQNDDRKKHHLAAAAAGVGRSDPMGQLAAGGHVRRHSGKRRQRNRRKPR